jgi:hypothetical protein
MVMLRRYKCILNLVLVIYSTGILSQEKGRESFFSLGVNVGALGGSQSETHASNRYQMQRTLNVPGVRQVVSVDGRRNLVMTSNTAFGFNAGWNIRGRVNKNITGIQVETQYVNACYTFSYPFKFNYQGDSLGQWVDGDNYFRYGIALMQTLWKSANEEADRYLYVKVGFGQTFHHRNFGGDYSAGYTENWIDKGTGFKLKVISSNPNSAMISPQAGYKFLFPDGSSFDIGLVYYHAFKNTRVVHYDFFRKDSLIGSNDITYKGSTFMLNMNYTFAFKPIKRDSVEKDKFLDLAEADTAHHSKEHRRKKINGKHYHIQETVKVYNPSVKLLVWDKGKVDGDEIALYLNGEMIVDRLTVAKKKMEIVLNLKEGSNILVMDALNLGRVPPNTAALMIDDGFSKNKTVTLVSDLKKSGAIELIYIP